MIKSEKKEQEKASSEDTKETQKNDEKEKKITPLKEEAPEEKLKTTQDKLLRAMAEMENQRRRFEKEKQEAFEYGGFNFALESLSLLDNIDRAVMSFKNDENLKNNKDLGKIIDGIEIVKKDLVSIFKKNGIISIELGAYGVPETIVVNKDRKIIKKFVGYLDDKSFKEINSILK